MPSQGLFCGPETTATTCDGTRAGEKHAIYAAVSLVRPGQRAPDQGMMANPWQDPCMM